MRRFRKTIGVSLVALLTLIVCAVFVVARREGGSGIDESGVASPSADGRGPCFVEVAGRVGLGFVHQNGAEGHLYLPEIMAGGVALFDYDDDGDLDVYFTNAHHGLAGGTKRDGEVNRLYRREADGTYQDVTEESGLGDDGYGMGVAIGDIDNDGDRDVYVTNLGADRLYRNRGDGTFEDVTDQAGINVGGWSCSAVFLDYDRDGFLDLYVTRYLDWRSDRQCFSASGRDDYCGPLSFSPTEDVLLHNKGDGTFEDVSEYAGIRGEPAAGLGVVCDDFNDDGLIDIYVANDAFANNLWINQGDGRFTDQADILGAAYNGSGVPEAGMGVLAADFDNDGDSDLFMTHLHRETNTMYRNDGPLRGFVDVSGVAGVGWSSVPFTGFGTAAFDLELDGDVDLLLVNGRVYLEDPLPGAEVPPPWDQLAEPNLFYANDGTGRFALLGESVAAFASPVEISRGVAVGDVDNDGDVDVCVVNLIGPSRLYRNEAPREGHWLIVRAMDPRLRRVAIGARVMVRCGGNRFTRTVSRGYSYLSSSDPRVHFGLGVIDRIDEIEVRWPDGLRERFDETLPNRIVELIRGRGEAIDDEPTKKTKEQEVAHRP